MYIAEHYTSGYWSDGVSGEGELHLILDGQEKEHLLNTIEFVKNHSDEYYIDPATDEWTQKLSDFIKEKWGE